MKDFDVIYRVNNKHGDHIVSTQFNLNEIKKFGLKRVIQYHANRLNLGERFGCHVDFGDAVEQAEEFIRNRLNRIGNLISKETYNRVYIESRK